MTGFARWRNGLALALAGLAGLGGCSNRPDEPIDTSTLELEREQAPEVASRTTYPGPPVDRAAEESLPASRPSPPRAEASEPAPAPEPDPLPADSTPSPPEPEPADTSEPVPDETPIPGVGGPEAPVERQPPAPDEPAADEPAADEPAEEETATGLSLPAGTTIRATLQDSISSRKQSAGDVVAARIGRAVRDRRGQVIVPAGSRVELSIAEIEPAKAASPEDARLVLTVDSILIQGRPHPVRAEVQAVPYKLQGRGVTGKEAGKVGIGAAAGAVLGRVLSGETEGAVVGGVVGAAGGGAVAARRARKDVVVKPGTPLELVLTEPLVLRE